MKPAHYIFPLLLSSADSFVNPRAKINSDSLKRNSGQSGTFADVISSRKAWNFADGLEGSDNEEHRKKKTETNSVELSEKDASSRKTMQYLIDNDLMKGVLNRVLYGFNPDIIMDEEGNNLAHVVANNVVKKTSDSSVGKEDATLHTIYGMEIIKQLYTSGINPKAKNKNDESVVDIFENKGHHLYKELGYMTSEYVKNQMNPMAEIKDQDNGDIMLPLFDSPTQQIFNIVSQGNPSKRARERAVKLVAVGANLGETRYDTSVSWLEKWNKNNGCVECVKDDGDGKTNRSYYEETALDVARKCWGAKEAGKLKKVWDVASGITDSLADFKMNSYSENQREKDHNVESINEALLESFRAWEVVTKDFIDGKSKDISR